MKSLILECLESGAEVTLSVKAKDLKEFAQLLLENAAKEAASLQKLKDEETYLSVDEAMSLLSIKERSTCWRWEQKGYLVPIRVGKKVLYRKSDIDAILNGGKGDNNG